MRKKIFILIVILPLILLTGCALFMNLDQLNKGRSLTPFGSGEGYYMQEKQLAINKLKEQPVIVGYQADKKTPLGYKGLVANLSEYRRYNYIINGPEKAAFYLGPGDRQIYYLIPGTYYWKIQYGDSVVSQGRLTVGAQQYSFMKENYHWYLTTEW
ncbi:hypothetical protein CO115_01160 [Candidatus Falkowbacteria bacterium CG_4_9_14_3_um_filter_36_9]|uniref:Uncharacterized protein n=2 Tax=Candidatus Falkowiibacteriota TaxID=1752728 RepID=A0A1J4TC84_9BACT|nr:MAG: hypothetical protein AUJ27_00780 [Candidatus Falkowbacteria bacterium CG1_02_37_44]PIV51077.1 MAG: hypothetical protein COS18_03320 [Candidatus Falkowbacteria bacterium CG02_land_8_20_14_3_00_36_14]PJA11182.1 MAG: hypothetical protein COX67_01145 [Candidatus Falkowbacteria bacterium CG_4_10_14_0_2_um_filter_36_22]PJB20506.1 MAG: hypothetical protein CO115_01160 [Candidatus Falkowbacteria bacterium CG_4_9_14_3_um_filter_36_9]